MSEADVVEYFGLGGNVPRKTFNSYETNYRSPSKGRINEIAELYEVSINVIKRYDYKNPIQLIYHLMWLEEEFPYYELNLDCSKFNGSVYNFNVQNGIRECKEMRDKRKNGEISDGKYLEWKLNFEIVN